MTTNLEEFTFICIFYLQYIIYTFFFLRKHVFEVPLAYCMSQERTSGSVQNECPTNCTKSDQQICGSDSNVYSSECEMDLMNCGLVIIVIVLLNLNKLQLIKALNISISKK